jgi:hypothetical protein
MQTGVYRRLLPMLILRAGAVIRNLAELSLRQTAVVIPR